MKTGTICRANSTLTGRLTAMTPPKADTGSQACALRWASAASPPTAIPQGLACLMMATHGRSWS